jgi:hypothetical protein
MLHTFARDKGHEVRTSNWRVVDRIGGAMTTCGEESIGDVVGSQKG